MFYLVVPISQAIRLKVGSVVLVDGSNLEVSQYNNRLVPICLVCTYHNLFRCCGIKSLLFVNMTKMIPTAKHLRAKEDTICNPYYLVVRSFYILMFCLGDISWCGASFCVYSYFVFCCFGFLLLCSFVLLFCCVLCCVFLFLAWFLLVFKLSNISCVFFFQSKENPQTVIL